MSHQVTEDELADYVEEQRQGWAHFALSSSAGQEVKRLEFCFGQVAPIYRVTLGHREMYIGTLKETAVREYNALA
jgi:hypothetical protein